MSRVLAKTLIVIACIVIMVYVLIAAFINYRLDFLTQIKLPLFMGDPVTTRIAAVILLTYVLGGFTGTIYAMKVNIECDETIDYYREKLAQISRNNDNDSALIDSLQRKISSLEIALQNALKDKDN